MAVFLRSTTASSVRNPWTQSRPWVAVSAPSAARPALRASTPPLPRQLPPPCRDSVSRPQQPADQGPGPRQGDGTQQPAAKGGAASSDDAAGTRTDSTLRRRQQAVETILASLQSYSSNASAGADQSVSVPHLTSTNLSLQAVACHCRGWNYHCAPNMHNCLHLAVAHTCTYGLHVPWHA